MKVNFKLVTPIICLILILSAVFVFAGNISPDSDSAPEPIFYTLTDIYNLIHNNETASPGNHSLSPTTEPTATTSYSVSQIYAELANLIDIAKVATSTEYLGIVGDYGNTDHATSSVDIISSSLTPTVPLGDRIGYSLEDVCDLINNNATTTPATHASSPSGVPDSSMCTLTEIYTALVDLGLAKAPYVNPDTTYLGQVGSYDPNADRTPPVVTTFYVPQNYIYLDINFNCNLSGIYFIATDDTAVTGYLITENDSTPAADANWSATSTFTYTFESPGQKTLYAWARDEAGNISVSKNDSTNVTLLEWSAATADTTWEAAEIYCTGLVGDWRVPTESELGQALLNQFVFDESDPGSFIDNKYYRAETIVISEENRYIWRKFIVNDMNLVSFSDTTDGAPAPALVRCVSSL
jgi:hypothetical protein